MIYAIWRICSAGHVLEGYAKKKDAILKLAYWKESGFVAYAINDHGDKIEQL